MTGSAASTPCASPKASTPGDFSTRSKKGSMCNGIDYFRGVYGRDNGARGAKWKNTWDMSAIWQFGSETIGFVIVFRPACKESTLYICDWSGGKRIMQAYKRTQVITAMSGSAGSMWVRRCCGQFMRSHGSMVGMAHISTSPCKNSVIFFFGVVHTLNEF